MNWWILAAFEVGFILGVGIMCIVIAGKDERIGAPSEGAKCV